MANKFNFSFAELMLASSLHHSVMPCNDRNNPNAIFNNLDFNFMLKVWLGPLTPTGSR